MKISFSPPDITEAEIQAVEEVLRCCAEPNAQSV